MRQEKSEFEFLQARGNSDITTLFKKGTVMKRWCALMVTLMSLTVWMAEAAETTKKIRVLMVSGDDVVPAHNWREMTQATREVLESSGKFDVKVSEDMFILESKAALANYDLIYLTRYNRQGTLTDGGKENLLEFVRQGHGFVVAHLASASFPEWAEFKALCGRYWVMGKSGHGPRGVFKATVSNKEHAITKGVADFETDDELYAKLEGTEPIQVLVEAYSDWSKKTEPLAFTREHGRGRVFHHTFGHDGKATLHDSVKRLIVQGTEWAATGPAQQSR